LNLQQSIPSLDPAGANIHKSVVNPPQRSPISDSPYRLTRKLKPGGQQEIQIFALLPWNPTGIWLEKVRTYSFMAAGKGAYIVTAAAIKARKQMTMARILNRWARA